MQERPAATEEIAAFARRPLPAFEGDGCVAVDRLEALWVVGIGRGVGMTLARRPATLTGGWPASHPSIAASQKHFITYTQASPRHLTNPLIDQSLLLPPHRLDRRPRRALQVGSTPRGGGATA